LVVQQDNSDTWIADYDDHAPQRGGSKEQPLSTARVPRFGAHWLRWLGAGGSVLLLSLFTLVGVAPALALAAAAGQVSEFPVPQGFPGTPPGFPGNAMVRGSDGNVWFLDVVGFNPGQESIGRITPAGQISEFGTPTAVSDPQDIALGSDGNIWFNEDSAHAVGRILTH
jgi:streptogramin lyase